MGKNGPQLAIRKGKWQLVLTEIDHDGTPEGEKSLTGDHAVFLSNLEEDEGEKHNPRRQERQVVDELQTLLSECQRDVERF